MFVLCVSCVQVTPIGVTTLYSTFSFFRRKKLLHQVGGTKVAQHGQTRYAHLMEILMWKKYHFQLYTRYGQLCRYYWWHIVCTILSLPAVPGPASVWPAASLTQFPVTHFHPAAGPRLLRPLHPVWAGHRVWTLEQQPGILIIIYLHWYTCHTCPGQAGTRVATCSILRAECKGHQEKYLRITRLQME